MTITENRLDNIFEEFKDKIVQVNFYQGFAKSVSSTALRNLNEEYEKAKEQDRESAITHMTNLVCEDILKRQKIKIGSMDISIKERFRILEVHRNKQYQWLLVEAYETFENYLNELYANIGYIDNCFWAMKDFGEISIDEIKDRDVGWFIDQTKKKKGRPESIQKQIRRRIPSLAAILKARKKNNPDEVDYEFMINLVSKLRHIIVHNNGVVADKSEFIRVCLEDIGLYNNGNPRQEYVDNINLYFGNGEFENLVALLELPTPTSRLPVEIYFDRLGDLLGVIASYAMLIHNLTSNHLAAK